MTSRYKCVFFTISLLFIAVAISPPWGHAGMRLDQDVMSGMNNMDATGCKSIFDGIPTKADCRICHGDTLANSVLHHNLIGTVIPGLDESTAPDAPGAVLDKFYLCESCHGGDELHGPMIDFRDCLQCHPVWIVTGPPGRGDNVHHDTFQHSDCGICHSD